MGTERSHREEGQRVLREEAAAIEATAAALGPRFDAAVERVLACPGRVIVTGLGKSGLVARKIAATLTSTGTPSLFIHPVEALHGDLGIAGADDVLLVLSRSGSNEEILTLVATLRARGLTCIALTCDAQSELARRVDLVLVTPVEREACPLGLSPTSSTTAALALGDALAMALLRARGLQAEDFAILHPSGALGRSLVLTVAQIMHSGGDLPVVGQDTPLRDALVEISGKRLGCTCVVDDAGRLRGFLSDGDLRRLLMRGESVLDRPVSTCMSHAPRTVEPDCLAREALRRMETNEPSPITQLVVVDGERPVGVVHIHDILRAGVRRPPGG